MISLKCSFPEELVSAGGCYRNNYFLVLEIKKYKTILLNGVTYREYPEAGILIQRKEKLPLIRLNECWSKL